MTPIEAKGHSGTVVFDGRTITIHRTGFLARAVVGKGQKQIPVQHITAVQWKPAGPLVNGYIQFTVAGGVEARSRAGSATFDAAKDENSVVFTRRQMGDFERLLKAVQVAQSAIAARGGPTAADPGVAMRIRQLAELRDQGLISSAEYEAKRQDLLAQM